jgi:hypothetical protein
MNVEPILQSRKQGLRPQRSSWKDKDFGAFKAVIHELNKN